MKIKAEVTPVKYTLELTPQEAVDLLGVADLYTRLPTGGAHVWQGQFVSKGEAEFAHKIVFLLQKKLQVSRLSLKPYIGWPMIFKAETDNNLTKKGKKANEVQTTEED